jgi:transcriptional regulator with XRE-family HTH domain
VKQRKDNGDFMIVTITTKIKTPEQCEEVIQKRLDQLGLNQQENISIFYDVLGLTMKKIRLKKEIQRGGHVIGKYYTQERVASWLGVTFQQIQKYENGINRIPFHSILIFVEKIKCDISEFTNYFDGIVLSMNKNAIQNAKTEENANVEQHA